MRSHIASRKAWLPLVWVATASLPFFSGAAAAAQFRGENGLCLHTDAGNQAVQANCTTALQITFDGYGPISAQGNNCLDTKASVSSNPGSFTDKALLIAQNQLTWNTCNSAKPSQRWSTASNTRINNEQGYCADFGVVPKPGAAPVVVAWPCNGGANQKWALLTVPVAPGLQLGYQATEFKVNGVAVRAGLPRSELQDVMKKIMAAGDGKLAFNEALTLVAAGGGNFSLVGTSGGTLTPPTPLTPPQAIVAAGAGNIVSTNGGNITYEDVLSVAGGGNLVATGGGNLVAAGGGNLVAAGGGNLVAAGGGNIVASGGGNLSPRDMNTILGIVAAGGGNLRSGVIDDRAHSLTAANGAVFRFNPADGNLLQVATSGLGPMAAVTSRRLMSLPGEAAPRPSGDPCFDPFVSMALRDATGVPTFGAQGGPIGSAVAGDCNGNLYNGGTWGSYTMLLDFVVKYRMAHQETIAARFNAGTPLASAFQSLSSVGNPGLCLGVAPVAGGLSAVFTAACNGSPSQQFRFQGTQILANNLAAPNAATQDLCLDAGAGNNGDVIYVKPCVPGTAGAPAWSPAGDELRFGNGGRVVDAGAGGVLAGVNNVAPGLSSQRWNAIGTKVNDGRPRSQTGALLAFVTQPGSTTLPVAPAGFQALKNTDMNVCLAVQAVSGGYAAFTAGCTGAATQQFHFDGVKIVVNTVPSLCLDAGAGNANDVVWARACTGANSQAWSNDGDRIRSASGRLLDAGSGNGIVALGNASPGLRAQQWTALGAIVAAAAPAIAPAPPTTPFAVPPVVASGPNCTNPQITAALNDPSVAAALRAAGHAPSVADNGNSGLCQATRYRPGQPWSSQGELNDLVRQSVLCSDPWIGQVYAESAMGYIRPNGNGVVGECAPAFYYPHVKPAAGGWSTYPQLRAAVFEYRHPATAPAITPATPPVAPPVTPQVASGPNCANPQITAALNDATVGAALRAAGHPASAADTASNGLCQATRYRPGQPWSNQGELNDLVKQSVLCTDPWIGEVYAEQAMNYRRPNGSGTAGECNPAAYYAYVKPNPGGWSNFQQLRDAARLYKAAHP